jgi:hypothetical protein
MSVAAGWPGQTCDKALCCCYIDGTVARWAVAHFGQAPAGSPLNCIALCLLRHAALRWPAAGDLRGASSHSLRGVVWVNDFVFYFLKPWHDACYGLAGGCPVCRCALVDVEALDAWWIDLCQMLGVQLNMTKHQCCSQSVEYSCFLFDTFRGIMLCLDAKLALLRTHAADLRVPDRAWSLLDLNRVKGRLHHCSAAIRHLSIRVTEMQRLMGLQSRSGLAEAELPSAYAPNASDHYDQLSPLPAGLSELAAETDYIITRYGPLGAPLWPPVASSAYAALLSSEEQSLYCLRPAGPVWRAGGRTWAPSRCSSTSCS